MNTLKHKTENIIFKTAMKLIFFNKFVTHLY